MVNLTHASGVVQVVSVQIREIYPSALSICRTPYHQSQIKLSKYRVYAAILSQFNRDFALTPLRSAIIISVSVRSAELRLVLYV